EVEHGADRHGMWAAMLVERAQGADVIFGPEGCQLLGQRVPVRGPCGHALHLGCVVATRGCWPRGDVPGKRNEAAAAAAPTIMVAACPAVPALSSACSPRPAPPPARS